jgi:hypothetical protein
MRTLVQDEDVLDGEIECADAVDVLRVRDEDLRLRVGHAMADAVVAVQHRQRQQDRAGLERSEERRPPSRAVA